MSKKQKNKSIDKPGVKPEDKAKTKDSQEPIPEKKIHTKFDRIDFIILLAIFLISLGLRIYGLSYPPTFNFDEVHYVPAAKSYFDPSKIDPNGIHPPLAKEIMAVFIKLYGDYSLGWRSGSVFFGMLMIVLMYLLGLNMFKNRFAAAMASFLLGIDFLHIVQSRIAILDIYLAAFILIGYYFAWLYIDRKGDITPEKPSQHNICYLIGAAVFFGAASAVKFVGIGAAGGAFLFIVISLWFEKKEEKQPASWQKKKVDKLGFAKTAIAIWLVFAVIMPFVFYVTHIPYFLKGGKFTLSDKEDDSKKIRNMFYRGTFKFHYTDKFTHPYLSQVWQWPTVHRPIWYVYETDTKTQTIRGVIAMGSLLFWWSFIPILFDMIYRSIKNKDKRVLFIVCGYLSLTLFWLSSASNYGGHWHLKGGFFFYMLPAVSFMALGVAETLDDLRDTRLGRFSIWAYLIGLVVFLIAFYPILTAMPISTKYYDNIMKFNIFKSWV